MLELARSVESVLVMAVALATLAIGLALAFVLAQRVVLKAAAWRRRCIRARYQAALDIELAAESGAQGATPERLGHIPRRHRVIVAEALLEPLRVVRGSAVDRARLVADDGGNRHHADRPQLLEEAGRFDRCRLQLYALE